MKRFEAFKVEVANKQHKLQFDILPHPPELLENIPVKYQVFLHGQNQGFLYRTYDGWKTNRFRDHEITTKLVEMIHVYYKTKEEHRKLIETKKKNGIKQDNYSHSDLEN